MSDDRRAGTSSADLLLHPVRLRIVRTFLGDRALTTSQLRLELPDVPTASLYRHVARLVDAGVLTVASERRIRGGVERTYLLADAKARVSAGEVAEMRREDHRRAFVNYMAGLLGDFDRYLERETVDPLSDGLGYNLEGLWLSDAELEAFVGELAGVLDAHLANGPAAGRRRRLIATILLPGEDVG